MRLLGSQKGSGPVVRGSGDFLKDMGHEARTECVSVSSSRTGSPWRSKPSPMRTPLQSAASLRTALLGERGDVADVPVAELRRIVAKLETER